MKTSNKEFKIFSKLSVMTMNNITLTESNKTAIKNECFKILKDPFAFINFHEENLIISLFE